MSLASGVPRALREEEPLEVAGGARALDIAAPRSGGERAAGGGPAKPLAAESGRKSIARAASDVAAGDGDGGARRSKAECARGVEVHAAGDPAAEHGGGG